MKTAKQWLIEQFGVVPLEFCAGGNGASTSYYNNTFKLAAQAGFGWCGWTEGYCGTDMVIIDWDFMGTSDSPAIVAAPPDAHDFGIVTDPGKFVTIFDQYPDGRFISINEFIGYLHASNSGSWRQGEEKLRFRVDYDPHYCQLFRQADLRPGTWSLPTGWWRNRVRSAGVKVDGKIPLKTYELQEL